MTRWEEVLKMFFCSLAIAKSSANSGSNDNSESNDSSGSSDESSNNSSESSRTSDSSESSDGSAPGEGELTFDFNFSSGCDGGHITRCCGQVCHHWRGALTGEDKIDDNVDT